ncbi:MAG TPA: hypothetical protein VF740_12090, partial [Candidatus Acidoferrum sp.]
MNSNFDRESSLRARRFVSLWTLAALFSVAQFSPASFAADPKEPIPLPEKPGEPSRNSIIRSAVVPTREGLTLRLTTDLGSVNVSQLEPGAPPVVRYTAHVETDAHGAAAAQLLSNYSLKYGTSSTGVEIAGLLFPPGTHQTDAQFWVQFEITVPRNYNVEIITGAGDITTGDIGGAAFLKTQGGNIITGTIGGIGVREVSRSRPVAKLETEGGHIKVMGVTGDLSAFTAGGHINVGDISG